MKTENILAALMATAAETARWESRVQLMQRIGAPSEAIRAIQSQAANNEKIACLIAESLTTDASDAIEQGMETLLEGVAIFAALGRDVRPAILESFNRVAAVKYPPHTDEQPSKTREEFMASWKEGRDEQGFQELKEMAAQPDASFVPQGVFVVRGSSEAELAEGVKNLLAAIFATASARTRRQHRPTDL